MDIEFSYFALCSVLCREGLQSTLVYWGSPLGEGKSGVKAGIVKTKVARRACAGARRANTPPMSLSWGTLAPMFSAMESVPIPCCVPRELSEISLSSQVWD